MTIEFEDYCFTVKNGTTIKAFLFLDYNYQLRELCTLPSASREEYLLILRLAVWHVSQYAIVPRVSPSFDDKVDPGKYSTHVVSLVASKRFMSFDSISVNVMRAGEAMMLQILGGLGIPFHRIKYRTLGEVVTALQTVLRQHVTIHVLDDGQDLYGETCRYEITTTQTERNVFRAWRSIDIGCFDSSKAEGHPEKNIERVASPYTVNARSGDILGGSCLRRLSMVQDDGVMSLCIEPRSIVKFESVRIYLEVLTNNTKTEHGASEVVAFIYGLLGIRNTYIHIVS